MTINAALILVMVLSSVTAHANEDASDSVNSSTSTSTSISTSDTLPMRVLLDGRWRCQGETTDDDMTMAVTSSEWVFALTQTYESQSETRVSYSGEDIAQLTIHEKGRFELQDSPSGRLIIFTIEQLALTVNNDTRDLYDVVEQARLKETLLSQPHVYVIQALDQQEWRVNDRDNPLALHCRRSAFKQVN